MIVKITTKPFYKNYFKKIVLQHSLYVKEFKRFSYRDRLENDDFKKIYRDIRSLKFKLKNENVKFLISKNKERISIYYNDDIKDLISDQFTIVEEHHPISKNQEDIQKNNRSIEVRNILYYNKYKHKIILRLSNRWGEHNYKIVEEIKLGISEIVSDFKFTQTKKSSTNATLSLDCTEDILFYINIKYEKYIICIKEIMLVSELRKNTLDKN